MLIRFGKLRGFSGDYGSARETLRQAVQIPQVSTAELQSAAAALYEFADYSGAILALEQGLALARQSGQPVTISLMKDLARAYLAEGSLPSAADILVQSLELDAEDASLYQTLALAQAAAGSPDAAIQSIDKGLSKVFDPVKKIELNYIAAVALRNHGNLKKALQYAESGLGMLNRLSDEYRFKGQNSAICQHKIQALAAQLARALLEPQKAQAYIGKLPQMFNLLDSYCDREDSAFKSFCTALELALEAGQFGETTADSHTVSTALISVQSLLALKPDHPRPLALRARLLRRQGKLNEARQTLEQSVSQLQRQEKPISAFSPASRNVLPAWEYPVVTDMPIPDDKFT
jgi:tetratricopeptide (TPR) repeat protein